MHTILVAGAGKSSIYLIQYLLTYAPRNKWKIIVADGDANAIKQKTGKNKYSEAAVIDITNSAERESLVKRADMVVSLMPPDKHILLAKDCLKYRKNLITSSYISDEMKAMDADVKAAGLMFMCEMGLDPGIDHMTANKIIHGIHRVAGSITSFKSYCGGLVAPKSDTNPWHYKFSWNPRNVVNAGLGGAIYMEKGKHTEVPYEKMFEGNKKIQVQGYGQLAWYPNRDSLRYLDLYEVPDIKTFLRATLRHPSFCKGWQAIIALGLTSQDDAFETNKGTHASWVAKKTGYHGSGSLVQHVAKKLGLDQNDKVMSMLLWLGLFDESALPAGRRSSADIMLEILQEKWEMEPEDKDLVAMQHEIEYMHKGNKIKLTSSMVIEGDNRDHSAMAKTVGLPMGILARLVLTNKIKAPLGVVLPNMPAVYRPVLTELAHYGITFTESVE
jgi:saccharopine dehydrogenase-like NADP-dependent oxidoreductase